MIRCSAGCGRELATLTANADALVLCVMCHPSDLSLSNGKHDRETCQDCQLLIAQGRMS